MRRSVFSLALVCMGVASLVLSPAATAQTGSLTFDPSTVVAGGGKLFINGSCEATTSGFVISQAFASQPSVSEFAGVPALPITTSSTGTFGIGLTIDPSVSPGAYSVSLRCGGGLAASGTLTVVRTLARTGAPVGKPATVGVVLLAVGVALAMVRRRRIAGLGQGTRCIQ
jgi:hypothetical protein